MTSLMQQANQHQPQSQAQQPSQEPLKYLNPKTAEDRELLLRTFGPHLYELHTVLVQYGGTGDGHYYAFIKLLSNGRWIRCNDTSVTFVETEEMLREAFGGYVPHTTAYMVSYRRLDLRR
jgi:ubiquitin C-terminal hydrolase